MISPTDPSSYSLYPKVRDDLLIVPQVIRGVQTYMIKDPVNRTYHRVGEMEHSIIRLLDGQKSFYQIQQSFEEQSGGTTLEANELEDFLQYLREADHLEKPKVDKSVLFYEKMRDKRKKKLSGKLGLKNILQITFPAFDPDKLFNRIIQPIRFFWSRGFLFFSFFCFFLVVLIAASNWKAFKEVTFGFYSFQGKGILDFVVIYLLFFVVVIVHECAHGLTCKHYGGEVHELGFLLYYFEPCFYCQVDDSYLFENKRHRIAVMVAGAYSELVLCSFAVFVWWLTPPDIFLHRLSGYVVAITGLVALIFNFNPLMKYDGYYILADYLEVLNLREESFKYVRNWLKKNILRAPVGLQDEPPRLRKIYAIYGVSALVYTAFMILVIFLMAKNLLVGSFHVWGIIILVVLAYLLLRKRAKNALIFMRDFEKKVKMSYYLRKRPIQSIVGLAIIVYLLFFFKINWSITKDFIVEPRDKIEIRSLNTGFVEDVLVAEGDRVGQNQLMAIIRNDSLRAYAEGLQSELAVTSRRMRADYLASDPLLLAADQKEKHKLEAELLEAERKLHKLEIHAPVSGTVLTPRIEERKGTFIEAGDLLGEIADLSRMCAKVYLSQWQVGDIRIGNQVELKIPSHSKYFSGRIIQLAQVPYGDPPSLYEARIDLDQLDQLLRPGMTGKAKITSGKVSCTGYVYRKVIRSLRPELWK